MKVKITVETFDPETGAHALKGGTNIVDEQELNDEIDNVLASTCDHYRTTPAERRPVVTIRIEFI